jgi:hypothetical protein
LIILIILGEEYKLWCCSPVIVKGKAKCKKTDLSRA